MNDELNTKLNTGLTKSQVEEKIARGLVNGEMDVKTKSYRQIVKDNALTLFNLINFILVLCIAYVGEWKNGLFFLVVVFNALIGIVQEIRAKKVIEKLSLLSAPKAMVMRDGKLETIQVKDILLGDIMHLKNGNQICADAVVLEGRCQVNESLITGESTPIHKGPGDHLLSGSFLVSGKVISEVEHIGADNYVNKITLGAKYFKKSSSVIMKSVKMIVRAIAIAIIPLSAIFIWTNFFRADLAFNDAMVKTVAAVSSMIPGGLVLLTSMILAVSVIRLAGHNTLVQDLYCVENLARVDVVCLDKTGTITEGRMVVEDIIPLGLKSEDAIYSKTEATDMLKEFAMCMDDENSTIDAVRGFFGIEKETMEENVKACGDKLDIIPFSSDRKWSLVYFKEKNASYIMGAPQFVSREFFAQYEDEIEAYAKSAKRVVFFARAGAPPVIEGITESDGSLLPAGADKEKTADAGAHEGHEAAYGAEGEPLLPAAKDKEQAADAGAYEGHKAAYGAEVQASLTAGKDAEIQLRGNGQAGQPVQDRGFVQQKLPRGIEPVGLIVIGDKIRENAKKTLDFFAEENVTLKVISGDDPVTVSMVAKEAGLSKADKYIDATSLDTYEKIEKAVEETTIFGRVTPYQKLDIVKALKAHGHTVAMTGDGANDVLALKEADCSVAMQSGAEAARNVANMVLLDSDFASLPIVVAEGRKTINNLQRSATLFLTKTTYAFCMAIIFAVQTLIAYPFENIQLTLISAITIGIPSFFLALEPNNNRIRSHFLWNVFKVAIPTGLMTLAAILISEVFMQYIFKASVEEIATTATYITLIVGLMVIANISGKLHLWKVALMVGLIALALVLIVFCPELFSLVPLTFPVWVLIVVECIIFYIIHFVIFRIITPKRESKRDEKEQNALMLKFEEAISKSKD